MKKNKLYTVNKWNKPAFMQDNIFAGGGNIWSSLATRGLDLSQHSQAEIDNLTNLYMNDTGNNWFGISKKNNSFSKGNLKQAGQNLLSGLAGSAGAAVGNLAGNAIAGGYSAGAGVGAVTSAIQAINTGNPIIDAAKNAVVGTLGGVFNRGFGIKENKENVAKINQNTDNMKAAKNTIGQASTVDDFLAMSSSMSGTSGFKAGDLYKNGWWTSRGTKKGNRLINAEKDAFAAQNAAAGYAANTVDQNQDEMVLRNMSAYGGPLDFGGGALSLMQQNRYFDTIDKRTDAIAGKGQNIQTGFTGGAKTFADGGLKATFFDEFGSDPIGAAVRYNQGLEALAAQEEAKEIEAAREAEYLGLQKRLANLETENQGLQALMAASTLANPTNMSSGYHPEITTIAPQSSLTPSSATSRVSSGNATWDYIEDRLRKSGKFNDVQIQGIKYNLQRESSLDPTVVGDGGTAFGLGQWHGSRQPKDKSLEGQTQHLINTLSAFDGKEHWINKKDYEGFLNARTPEEAHYYIAKGYERPKASIVAKVKRYSDMSLKNLNAFGGELGTNGTDFTNGLLYIDEGGSHESNPLEGVPMGLDPEGIPNLVEEGETVYNDYVFSDRMKVPNFMLKDLGLPKSKKCVSFADASKKLAQESEKRPNDPISRAGLQASLSKLAEIQETERMRKQAEEYTGLEGYACGGKMGRKYKGEGYWPNTLVLGDPLTRTKIASLKKTKNNNSNNKFGPAVVLPATPAVSTSTEEDFRKEYPMIAAPVEKAQKSNYTDGSIWGNTVSIAPFTTTKNGTISTGVDEGDIYDKNPYTYPTWMRYAPVVGLGSMALTDALGITNKPDYTMADKIEAAAQVAGLSPNVSYKPIGNYLAYRPMDIWFEQNRLNANARATDRAIMDSAAPIGTKMAGLLAANYNNMVSSGDLYRKALEYNDNKRKDVADFNRKTDMFNSQMGLEASMANARYQQAARQAGLSGLAQAAALRDAIDARVGASKSANLSNFLTSLGNIGRENFAMNQINWDKSRHYGTDASGRSGYKRKHGGKINK